jgi:6-phosphogluconolactonase (cycloisomerase 2 family)
MSRSMKLLATFVLIPLTLLSGGWPSVLAQEASSESSKELSAELAQKINRWIRELDDDSFQIREEAEKNLIEIGLPAWDAVLKATESPSNEVRTRARKILATYRQRKKHLQFVHSESRPELRYAVSATVSTDGKFVYAAAWQGHSICVYSRDAKTGRLNHLQTIQDQNNLSGAISLRLSPDGGYALATAFLSQTAVLFRRDAKVGTLTVSDVARQGQNDVDGLRWALDSVFSPDSKFAYIIDPRGTGTRIETVDGQPGLSSS